MPNNQKGLSVDQHTIAEHRWKTTDGHHTLYIQEWGNRDGKPVLFLHGGPGSGCHDGHKLLFDPKKHYVVFHDQRGCGNSTPANSLKENTTPKLLDDIRMITEKLSLDSFAIFGRSWGCTLALCYAIKFPEQVNTIVTGGVYLGTREEADWIDKGEYKTFYPEVWESHQKNPSEPFAYAQATLAVLKIDDRYPSLVENEFDTSASAMERHYMDNDCFLPRGHIINNTHMLNMPVAIVQGRYDMWTPPITAYQLYKSLPNASLQWTIAGHSSSDRANFDVSKAVLSQL